VSEQAVDPLEEEKKRRAIERALRHRAELFASLEGQDAFAELLKELERKQERMVRTLVDGAMRGVEINQRQVDYDRGFVDGMKYIRQVVKAASNTLSKADAEASVSEPDDERSEW
jgi:hypothetical protein